MLLRILGPYLAVIRGTIHIQDGRLPLNSHLYHALSEFGEHWLEKHTCFEGLSVLRDQ